MKTLSNNRGISLVILVIAMTLIAMLGAAFVSVIGTKHRGFLHQNDSYRALNIANAGVEYAIRYVGDSTDPTGNNLVDFFHSPSSYANIKIVSSIPDTTNLADVNQWKRVDFGNGQFYISYYLNLSQPDDVSDNKILYSVGVFGQAKRIVKLRSFLNYASPASVYGLDRLNLVPNQRPYISGNYVVIPVMNVSSGDIVVASIQFEVDLDNNLTKEFTDIYFRNSNGIGGDNVYRYTTAGYSPYCSAYPAPPSELPCGQWDWYYGAYYVEIPDSPSPHTGTRRTTTLSVNRQINKGYIRWFSLRFNESGVNLRGLYTVTFNFAGGGSSTVRFYAL